ncbi:muscarinic acetylcholine receptor M5-like [Pocillopora damicornis]|uniref:muscarinic acetylcholine receptor M5-like n=1 Tax=Pocillopora damicornis TaxID=46731 RepID=UPI000F5520EC|nr:muscarinic acetylcholine receptor M5-like [Pocillopora damicornis]
MDFNSWNIFWDICFGVLVTMIIAGNILTIWIFFKQRHQKRSYSLLISLAVADLLVGIFAVPFYIKAVVSRGYAWFLISMVADVFTGITSIYTLAVISLERMCAVGWPFRHRTVNYRVYVCAIGIPWIIAAILSTALMLRMLDIIGGEVYFYCLVLIPGIPLITIYCVNGCFLLSLEILRGEIGMWPARTNPLTHDRQLKVMENVHRIEFAFFVIKTLQFSNSFVNVIIYPFRIPEFRRTVFQILNFCVIPFRRSSTELSPSAEPSSVVSLITFTNSTFSPSNFTWKVRFRVLIRSGT